MEVFMEKSLKKWVDCAGHVRLQNQWRILDSSSKIAKSGKIGGTSMAMWPLKTCHTSGRPGSLAATKPWDAADKKCNNPWLGGLTGGSPRP